MLKLIWRNLIRKKLRTSLTVLSIGIALVLISFLQLVLAAMSGVEGTAANRLVVRNAISLTFRLPASYEQRLQTLDHVEGMTILNWFQGQYIDDRPENRFPRFGTNPETLLSVFPEMVISEDEVTAWRSERASFIAGQTLVDEQGWEIGDVISIQGDITPVDLELTLRGIFANPDDPSDERRMYFDWQYVEEALGNPGIVGMYYLRLDSADSMDRVISQIEAMFENSPDRVRAETEEAFFLSFLQLLGNVQFLFNAIGLAVIASIFFITVNTMAMASRERVTEVAVLRTLGFSRPKVLSIVMIESLGVGLLGAIFGASITPVVTNALTLFLSGQGVIFNSLEFTLQTLMLILGIGIFLGLAAGLVPAAQAINLKIVDGLRQVT
tara:strand:+ start:301 stop:1449 length:1149 start_codon:yes stop_codon:yes gene_type:complete